MLQEMVGQWSIAEGGMPQSGESLKYALGFPSPPTYRRAILREGWRGRAGLSLGVRDVVRHGARSREETGNPVCCSGRSKPLGLVDNA